MRDKIEAMEAGLELDMLVGQYVIGFEDYLKETDKRPVVRDGRYGKNYFDLPNYSSDISAAFEVVNKMAEDGWMMYKLSHTLSGQSKVDGFICVFLNIQSGAGSEYTADTASEAICKAALLSVIES